MKPRWTLFASALCLCSTLADAVPLAEQAPWSSSRSKAPSKADWDAAARVDLSRARGDKARGCELKHLREWLYVRCGNFKASAITELSGSATDVSYFIEPAGADRLPGAGQLIYPVRPGERRVFSFWTLGPGYDGPLTVVPAVVLQSSWTPGSDQPRITLTDALHEPVATKTHPRTSTKER